MAENITGGLVGTGDGNGMVTVEESALDAYIYAKDERIAELEAGVAEALAILNVCFVDTNTLTKALDVLKALQKSGTKMKGRIG